MAEARILKIVKISSYCKYNKCNKYKLKQQI